MLMPERFNRQKFRPKLRQIIGNDTSSAERRNQRVCDVRTLGEYVPVIPPRRIVLPQKSQHHPSHADSSPNPSTSSPSHQTARRWRSRQYGLCSRMKPTTTTSACSATRPPSSSRQALSQRCGIDWYCKPATTPPSCNSRSRQPL